MRQSDSSDQQPLMSPVPPSPSPSSPPNNNNNNNTQNQSATDPFHIYKESIQTKINQIEGSIQSYVSYVNNNNTSSNQSETSSLKKVVKKQIKSADNTLKDLQMTVRLVENDRLNFGHIDDNELFDRKQLLTDITNTLSSLRSSLDTPSIKAKMVKDQNEVNKKTGGNLGATNDYQQGNTDFVQNRQAEAQIMIREQDETLHSLDSAVSRVHNMADDIHVELNEQNVMLTELEEDLDEAELRLGVVMGKLGKLLKTKDGCQLGTIIGLFLTLVVLTFLVFYT